MDFLDGAVGWKAGTKLQRWFCKEAKIEGLGHYGSMAVG